MTLAPLSIFLETDDIPDMDREVWPLQTRRVGPAGAQRSELILWVQTWRKLCLDTFLSRAREGLNLTYSLFPFLRDAVKQVDIPLKMDTCFTGAQRLGAVEYLENSLLESSCVTSFGTQTRIQGMYSLSPHVRCHLPYPAGTLEAARELFEEWTGPAEKGPTSPRKGLLGKGPTSPRLRGVGPDTRPKNLNLSP